MIVEGFTSLKFKSRTNIFPSLFTQRLGKFLYGKYFPRYCLKQANYLFRLIPVQKNLSKSFLNCELKNVPTNSLLIEIPWLKSVLVIIILIGNFQREIESFNSTCAKVKVIGVGPLQLVCCQWHIHNRKNMLLPTVSEVPAGVVWVLIALHPPCKLHSGIQTTLVLSLHFNIHFPAPVSFVGWAFKARIGRVGGSGVSRCFTVKASLFHQFARIRAKRSACNYYYDNVCVPAQPLIERTSCLLFIQ